MGLNCHIYVLLNKYIGVFLPLFFVPFTSHYSQWKPPQEVFLSWLHFSAFLN